MVHTRTGVFLVATLSCCQVKFYNSFTPSSPTTTRAFGITRIQRRNAVALCMSEEPEGGGTATEEAAPPPPRSGLRMADVRATIDKLTKENFAESLEKIEPFLLYEAGSTMYAKSMRRLKSRSKRLEVELPAAYAKEAKATAKRRAKQDAFIQKKEAERLEREEEERAAAEAAEAEAAAAVEAEAAAKAEAEAAAAAEAEAAAAAEAEAAAAAEAEAAAAAEAEAAAAAEAEAAAAAEAEAAKAAEAEAEAAKAAEAEAAAAAAEPVAEAPAVEEAAPVAEEPAAEAPAAAPAATGTISAKVVKELRDSTGAGMMDCKKALQDCGGDMEAAAEALRKKGLAKADKKASRVAAEGKIASAVTDDKAVLVEVNCETDFVAKDGSFLEFADKVANTALGTAEDDVAALMEMAVDGESLESIRQAMVAKIGENIQVRRLESRGSADSTVGCYVHMNKIGVLVELEGGTPALAADVAMHVAAMNPPYARPEDVPGDVIEKEKKFLTEQALESGKPKEIVEKMIEGRIRKYLEEICVVSQTYVKTNDQTVEKFLESNGAKMLGFTRIAVGEGIEKKEDNFADEVAKMASAA